MNDDRYGTFVYDLWFIAPTPEEVIRQVEMYESTLNRRLLSFVVEEM